MSDLIKREDVIKLLRTELSLEYFMARTVNKADKNSLAICDKVRELPTAEPQWIPCSERLPEDSGDYLVCPSNSALEDYSEFSDVAIVSYDADCEAFGWWVDHYHPISLGYLDSEFNEFEVIAWLPLPKVYRGEDDV